MSKAFNFVLLDSITSCINLIGLYDIYYVIETATTTVIYRFANKRLRLIKDTVQLIGSEISRCTEYHLVAH